MEFDFKQVPAILPTFPPMPKPEDYGIDWNDAGLAKAYQQSKVAGIAVAMDRGLSYSEAKNRVTKFQAQNELYQQALAAWKGQVEQIAQAIRTNK